MQRTDAEQIFAACENALAELTMIEHTVRRIEDESERKDLLKSLSFVIADLLGTIRAPVVRQFPDLDPTEEPGEPDDVLDEKDEGLVSSLSPAELKTIDQALTAECVATWRKSARVVMGAMKLLEHTHPDLPIALYAQRIALLVHSGELESQGSLRHLRFSEVRLAWDASAA